MAISKLDQSKIRDLMGKRVQSVKQPGGWQHQEDNPSELVLVFSNGTELLLSDLGGTEWVIKEDE